MDDVSAEDKYFNWNDHYHYRNQFQKGDLHVIFVKYFYKKKETLQEKS